MQSQGGSECLLPEYEDILMKKILQSHAPEEHQVDSASLLDLTERIFLNFAVSTVLKDCRRNKEDAKIVNAVKQLGLTVHHMSCEMLQHISTDRPPKATTYLLLESLERHRWSTKLTIVLAALASSYGNYWLIARFCLTNPLAFSLAAMKGQLRNYSLKATTMISNYRLKALRYLLEKMVSVAKCVMEFEILPANYVSQDYEALAMMKNQVHIASYWVIRSSVECASQITSTIALGFQQAKVTPEVWELWSLAKKISYIYEVLRNNFDAFSQQIEKKVHLRLLNLFAGVHDDNQDVLYTLFAQKDDFPLRDSCSQEKVSVNVLSNKVVMLFISSLHIYPEKLLLVVQQSEKKKHSRPEELEYEIVWIPAMYSAEEVERRVYDEVVDILPWYSITEPSNLSSSVMKFIKEVWHFQGDPMMVSLDHGGNVSSLDAFDMVAIWGSKAYPFTTSKERELWEEQRWTMELLLDNIDPLFSYWMEERRIICLYGTNDLGWARELSKTMKALSGAGVPLELIYVGSNDMHEQTSSTLTRVMEEKLSRYLSHVNIRIFWLRLQSMRSSRQRLGYATESDDDDSITQEIDSLLSSDDTRSSGWLLVGEGASGEVLKLGGNQALESLSNLHAWGQKIRRLGFSGALLKSLGTASATEPCDYSVVTPFSENSVNGEPSVCKKCKSVMEKHIMYQCGTC